MAERFDSKANILTLDNGDKLAYYQEMICTPTGEMVQATADTVTATQLDAGAKVWNPETGVWEVHALNAEPQAASSLPGQNGATATNTMPDPMSEAAANPDAESAP